jgi:hypothetical protein
VTPLRLHPLWYSSLLPLFFILSAMGAGMMVIILVRILHSRWYDREAVFGPQPTGPVCLIDNRPWGQNGEPERGRDMPMRQTLAVIATALLEVYLAIKIVDLWRTGAWSALTAGTWESWLYVGELALTAVLPGVLVAIPRVRRSPTGLGIAAFSAAAGLALNRLNVGIFGYFGDAQTVYFPSLIEWALGVGVVAGAALVFLFIVENASIFDESWKNRRVVLGTFQAAFETFSQVWRVALTDGLHRVTLIGLATLPLAWVLLYPPFHDGASGAHPVRPALGLDATRSVLRIDGNQAGVMVEFPHVEHQKRLGQDSSCSICHHVSLPHDRSTPCSRCHRDMLRPTRIFEHTFHTGTVARENKIAGYHPTNHSCTVCHPPRQPKTAESASDCYECHRQDMWLVGRPDSTMNLLLADGYQTAMHDLCIDCHRREQAKLGRTDLADCAACHRSLRMRESTTATLAEAH